jgi:hypothetical protein
MSDSRRARLSSWPKDITRWYQDNVGYLSIPFTWLLPKAQRIIDQRDMWIDRWVVGGPAVRLMPDYLQGAETADHEWATLDVLQRVNPAATRTTLGCPNKCGFCGIGKGLLEGGRFRELPDWPDRPVLIDSNLLAAHHRHFDRVIDRLVALGEADFNQGLDARLLTPHHARRIAEIPKVIVRLALDGDGYREAWADAVTTLRRAGIPKSRIRSYVLCGFRGTPEQDRARCDFAETVCGHHGAVLPMWYHPLDAMKHNAVTPAQRKMGWTKLKQRELMVWFYWHRTLESRG